MYHLAFALSVEGDLARAAETFRAALQRFEALDDRRGVADSLFGLSIACRLQGDLVTAQKTAAEALRLHRERGDPFGIYGALYIAGRADAELGDLDASRRQLLEALGMAVAFGDRTGVALSFDNLADEDISRGQPERAMRLAGASEAIKEVVGGQAPPELIHLPDPRARARSLLSEAAIQAAWNEGRAMTLEQALDYARRPT
jgi:tetratricopeptide (TPR) repeat protein